MSVLFGIWLLVIGYGLLYVGYQNQSGKKTSFAQAFLPSGLLGAGGGGSAGPVIGNAVGNALNPIQAKGSSPVTA